MSTTKVCSLCCHEASAWALGSCDHPTCLACCVRMRVLCNQRECPVCREELDQVVVVGQARPFLSISHFRLHGDRKYGILFEKPELNDLYKSLRDHACSLCPEIFRSWSFLRDHTRKIHDRHYCDICLDNLKLFPFEFKTYTQPELTRHRREGDPDNTSHRGHPLCKFCDERYLDKDALHTHLRENHFWCHFCESDGKQEFYSKYPALRKHFKTGHFLCEEGSCRDEQFTSVFRTKLDLQAHRAQVHTKGLSKAETKQLRQVEVGFTVVGRTEESTFEYVQPRGRQGGPRGRAAQLKDREEAELATALSASMQHRGDRGTADSTRSERRRTTPPQLPQPPTAVSTTQGPVDRKETAGQSAQEPVSFYREILRPQDVKKPPGFESVVPRTSTRGKEAVSEWPDLSGNAPVNPTPSKQPPRYAYATSGIYVPPGFTAVSSAGQAPPTRQGVQSRPSGLSHPDSRGRNPPKLISGQISGFPPLSNGPSPNLPLPTMLPVATVTDGKAREAEVINNVRAILSHDRGKFSQFKTLSGWFTNNEITVEEYARQCYTLMGEAWNEIGPQLASVIPDKSKQKELSNFFKAELEQSYPQKKSTKRSKPGRRQTSAWRGASGYKEVQLSEEEYPSLGSMAPAKRAPPGMSNPWNLKVQV